MSPEHLFERWARHRFARYVAGLIEDLTTGRVQSIDGRKRAEGWARDEGPMGSGLTIAVIAPDRVVHKWHVAIADREIVNEGRYHIRAAGLTGIRTCEMDPRAVLIICPVQ